MGCVVDVCLACEACGVGDEYWCVWGMVGMYGDEDKYGCVGMWLVGGCMMGGYVMYYVVDEWFGI